MLRCNRNEAKGNVLKRVVTRIDFQDLFEVPKDVLREVGKICSNNKIDINSPKFLDITDFQFNDTVTSISFPYEYIKDLNSILFFNNEKTFIVEINQLFLKITQVVNDKYKRYGETLKLISEILLVLKDPDKTDIKVKRISIKKANQVFFDSIDKFKEYFKDEILRFNLFENVDWSKNNCQSTMVQNFEYNDCKVNFARTYDNGLINNNKYYRLYFDIETYLNGSNNMDIVDLLTKINEYIFELFEWTLTGKAIECLKNGERIGDIE